MPPRETDVVPTPNMSWTACLNHSRNSRNEIRSALSQNFSKATLVNTTEGLKIFALGHPPNSTVQTIISVSVPISEISKKLKALSDCKNGREGSSRDQHPIELRLTNVFKQDPFRKVRTAAPSADFALMCERQRTSVVHGVTDYNSQDGNVVLLGGDQIYRYSTTTNELITMKLPQPANVHEDEGMDFDQMIENEFRSPGGPRCGLETPSPVPQPSLSTKSVSESLADSPPVQANFVSDAKICPVDESIIAYVLNSQIYIDKGGEIIYHTQSDSKYVSSGVPPYICLEELERYEAIWWSSKEKRLLYEQVDERMVAEATFGINGKEPSSPMKYPRAGTVNAYSTIRMLIIDGEKVYDVGLKSDLRRNVQFEYITRAGFHSDGKSVWIQVMSRKQTDCALLIIPETDFELPPELIKQNNVDSQNEQIVTDSDSSQLSQTNANNDCDFGTWVAPVDQGLRASRGPLKKMAVVHAMKCDHWINTNNSIVCLSIEDINHPVYRFTYYVETSKGNFLYMLSSNIDEWGSRRGLAGLELMDPMISLNKSVQLKVDEKRKLVYYVANESDVTEWNICVSSYSELDRKTDRGVSKRLTEAGLCVKQERANSGLAIDFDVGFVCWVTSQKMAPACRFYALQYDESDCLPKATFVAQIFMSTCSNVLDEIRLVERPEAPEIVEYTSPTTNTVFYGMIIKPADFDPTKKYPVIHYVYGGPGIQVVHNDYTTWVPFIKYTKLGFVVVMLDNRGTANRGVDFERQIGGQLGSVEVDDQVEGLHILARLSGNFMDLSRVVVHGWSYGGYMSLLMLALHPKVYRGAIAGGAVTDWRLYDTAYTERYMGYPVVDSVYDESSVLRLVDSLPDEPNRLMLIHGLMDENVHVSHLCAVIDNCIKRGKYHELLLFPNERHGIRNSDSAAYLDARMLFFIQKCLQEPVRPDEW